MLVNLSTPAVPGIYINRVKQPTDLMQGWEMGSLAIQNPAGGLFQQLWKVATDGTNVFLSAPNTPAFVLFTDTNISEIDLAFDQNMFPFVTYVSNGLIKFYWYDPTIPAFVTSTIEELAWSPRCTLDDKREFDISNSDIILAYINLVTGQLCYRIQRERYQTEHNLASATLTDHLRCINAATPSGNINDSGLRLQMTMDDYTLNVSRGAHNGLANYTRPISITGAYIT